MNSKKRMTLGALTFSLVLLTSLAPSSVQAQRSRYVDDTPLRERAATTNPHLVSAQFGAGFLTLLHNKTVQVNLRINDETETYAASLSGTPAYSFGYDYRINRTISLGGMLAFQGNRFEDFRASDGKTLEGVSLRARRTLVAGRVLFHYGNSPHLEMYSGLRLGVTVWGLRPKGLNTNQFIDFDLPLNVGTLRGALPFAQFVPFGLRAQLTPALSLGGELALGSPHFAAVQLGYRF